MTENKKISVIIPAYDRSEALYKCLSSLAAQSCPRENFEILVVDDGLEKKSEKIVKKASNEFLLKIKYLKQEHKGPAAARNLAIKAAAGELLLFLGDDILAGKELLERHAVWHSENAGLNKGALGYITWAPDLEATPFMRWLENGGPQFDFISLKNGERTDYTHFYSSNLSIKTSFIKDKNLFFDEDFPYAAYEDTEFGYRLEKAGFSLFYLKQAWAWHYHATSAHDAAGRMLRVGMSRRILNAKLGIKEEKKINAVHFIFKKIKAYIYFALTLVFEKRKMKPVIFAGFCEGFYAIGFYGGKKEKACE